jgi:hypothetical protein
MPDLHDQHHIGRLDAIDHAVFVDDDSQILDPEGQSQASSWETRGCFLRRRASATVEKYRSSWYSSASSMSRRLVREIDSSCSSARRSIAA